MKREICPVCGDAAAPAATGLLECGVCGLVFKAEKTFDAPVYGAGMEDKIYGEAKREIFSSAADFIELVLPPESRLLDIGCAGGEFLKCASGRGWETEGVELDRGLAAKASSAGYKIYLKPVEKAGLPENSYNAVTAFEVFSQMDAPAAAAAEIFRLMVPGGVLYIREFNASFHLTLYGLEARGFFKRSGMSPSVIHNFNFRSASLLFLLRKAGFRDIKIRNSRPTSGDPYRTGGALGGFFTGVLKILYYWLAEALWFITSGRVYAGSALIVTARKPQSDKGGS